MNCEIPDCLICEKCGQKEYTVEYCRKCVDETLSIMQYFGNVWDMSESAKERLYENILQEHRSTK